MLSGSCVEPISSIFKKVVVEPVSGINDVQYSTLG